MSLVSEDFLRAEREMAIPPVSERGRRNENPEGIGFWALVAEDFRTHESRIFEQGFWAVFSNRFGNWRMGQPKIVRAPCTLLYMILFKTVEILGGISLWYTVKLGRRVRIWHHSGMVLGARAIGDDVHIRQGTTFGVGQTGRNADLPIIRARADIGAGACIVGSVVVGEAAKIGGNALVLTDIPDGAVAMGNPAQIVSRPRAAVPEQAETPARTAATAPEIPENRAVTPPPRPHAEEPAPMVATEIPMGRVALLGSANLDYLAMTFQSGARRYGLSIETEVPDFGTAPMELLKPREASALQQAMQGELSASLVAERADDLLGEAMIAPLSIPAEEIDAYLDEALRPMLRLIDGAESKLKGPVLVLTLAAFQAPPLGLADRGEGRGRAALIARANEKLAEAVAGRDGIHLLDAGDMMAQVGRQAAAPGKFWHLGRVPFGEAFNEELARRAMGALLSLRGKSARIVVLDLDNTLWGGVLGEDGIEGVKLGGGAYPGSAYRAFQEALRALTDRGIVLALASKNDEDLALRMISEHPEMAIRLGDVVAHRIDWSEKAVNIQDMLNEIGLGSGSCLFIDDNPVERQKVRKTLPDCIVPDFPDAPEALVDWLLANPFLETVALTESDFKRSGQYKVRAKVNAAKRSVENIEDFYRDLDMHLTFEPLGPMNQQRVMQLFVKTNQFNTTTRRHDIAAVRAMLDEGAEIYAVGYRDAQSEYELMGVLVLRPDAAMRAAYPDDVAVQSAARDGALWVDSFLLSCRILGRTVEQAILAWAQARARATGASALIGQIIETPRNTPVRSVFDQSGFSPEAESGIWIREFEGGADPVALPDWFTIETSADAPGRPVLTEGREASVPAAPARPSAAPQPERQGDALPSETSRNLAATFRTLFRLPPETDLSRASMESVEAWDSLGHLKLAMEVERSVGVRLPGDALGEITTYPQLSEAVAARL